MHPDDPRTVTVEEAKKLGGRTMSLYLQGAAMTSIGASMLVPGGWIASLGVALVVAGLAGIGLSLLLAFQGLGALEMLSKLPRETGGPSEQPSSVRDRADHRWGRRPGL